MQDPVRMYHPTDPETFTRVERLAYRDTWFAKGWLSDDDPDFFGDIEMLQHAVTKYDGFGAQWFVARREARLKQVHWWGDSIAVGDDASSDGAAGATSNTHAQKDAWRDFGMVGVVASRLQTRYGDGGSGFSPMGLSVTTGSWASGKGMGTTEFRCTAAASAEWHVRGDRIRLFFRQNNMPAGSFRYQIDGGAFTTVTPPVGFGIDPGVVTISGLDPTEHTVRVEWVSGTVAFNGVEGVITGANGVVVSRLAQHGLAANDLSSRAMSTRFVVCSTTSGSPTLTSTLPTFTPADIGASVYGTGLSGLGSTITAVTDSTHATMEGNASSTQASTVITVNIPYYPTPAGVGAALARKSIVITSLNPPFSEGLGNADIVVLALNVNDPSDQRHTPENLIDAYSAIVKRYASMGDDVPRSPEFVVLINHIGKWFDVSNDYPEYVNAAYSFAESVNGAVVDMWNAGRRSWKYMQDRRYWAGATYNNNVHLSKSGHSRVGNTIANLFT